MVKNVQKTEQLASSLSRRVTRSQSFIKTSTLQNKGLIKSTPFIFEDEQYFEEEQENNMDEYTNFNSMACLDSYDPSLVASTRTANYEFGEEDNNNNSQYYSDTESTTSIRFGAAQNSYKTCKNIKVQSIRKSKIAQSEKLVSRKKCVDFNIMRFQNSARNKTFRIVCFKEEDLKVPDQFTGNIVNNESDDDKESDNEQVKSAVSYVHASLLEAVENEKTQSL